jgi:hypothetical protein
MRPLSLLSLPALAALALAGCDRWILTFETRIDPAARMTRTARIEHQHDHETGEAPPENPDAIGRIFRLPEGARTIERSNDCVVLEQRASEPREAAPDFVFKIENAGRREPRNAIDWRREDCVFFDHWVYREEFRDSVDEADRDAATERLVGYLREIALQAAAMDTDGRYDLAPLEAWLDGPGRRLVFDAARIACTEKDSARLAKRLAARLGAEGIAVGESGGANDAELAAFFEAKLPELLPPKDGAPPYDARPLFAKDAEGETRISALLELAATTLHGSKEAAQKAGEEALRAVIGDVGNAPLEFTARVTLPGRVLRTNGIVEECDRDARVFWTFGAHDIASTGHTLELETVVWKPEALAQLPRAKAELDAGDVLAVILALDKVDEAGRARLGLAFREISDETKPADARGRLPEELAGPFDTLLKIGARAE